MSRATPLREAVKARFYPFALERGFVREKATSLFVPFRRIVGSTVQVFEIQWDKSHRPRFVVNFGEAPLAGIDFFGEHVTAELVAPHQCPVNGRLQRRRGGTMRVWFQTSKPWPETIRTLKWAYTPEEVAAELMSSFAELESWWETKQEGPRVSVWRTN